MPRRAAGLALESPLSATGELRRKRHLARLAAATLPDRGPRRCAARCSDSLHPSRLRPAWRQRLRLQSSETAISTRFASRGSSWRGTVRTCEPAKAAASEARAELRLATATTGSPASASKRPRACAIRPAPAIPIGPWEERPRSLDRADMAYSWRMVGDKTMGGKTLGAMTLGGMTSRPTKCRVPRF